MYTGIPYSCLVSTETRGWWLDSLHVELSAVVSCLVGAGNHSCPLQEQPVLFKAELSLQPRPFSLKVAVVEALNHSDRVLIPGPAKKVINLLLCLVKGKYRRHKVLSKGWDCPSTRWLIRQSVRCLGRTADHEGNYMSVCVC